MLSPERQSGSQALVYLQHFALLSVTTSKPEPTKWIGYRSGGMPFYWARELQHRSHQVALSIFVVLRNEDGSECLCFRGANRFEENAKISVNPFCIPKRSVFLRFRSAFPDP